jgi:hypothetical protein
MKINLRAEKIFLFIFMLVLVYQMIIPPIVGLADNGDFVRIMDKVGIQPGDGKEYFGNINLQFPISFHFNIKGYQSSELIFVLSSILLNSIVSKEGVFHLLSLGVVHLSALLVVLAVVAYGVSRMTSHLKWVIYAFILVFFSDVGYVAYLNSIYSEPASLIFLTLTIGIVLLVASQVDAKPVGIGWALAFFVSAFLFVIAKPQNAAMGIPLALMGYLLMKHVRPPRRLEKWRTHVALILSFGLVIGSFLLFAFGLPRYYRSGDLWNSVFLEIIGNSQNPQQDLSELGLPPDMIIYKGQSAFAQGVNRNAFEEFQHSWLYFKIFKFYLFHPARFISLMEGSTTTAFELRPSNLGNFVSSESFGSYDQSQAFAIWSKLRVDILPKSIWTLIGLFLINVGAVWVKIKKFDHGKRGLLISELHITIIFMAVLQYITVLMAEGTFELVKHMFLFNVLLDITFLFLITYLVDGLIRGLYRVRDSKQAKAQEST